MNGFEKWAKEIYGENVIDDTPRYKSLPYLTDLKMAYNAGVAAERERCAGIAEKGTYKEPAVSMGLNHQGYNRACKGIAAAIRRGDDKKL